MNSERDRAEEACAYHRAEREKSNNDQYLSWLLDPLQITENSTFLDLGCGSGYVNDYLASTKVLRHNIGFDFDLSAVRLARESETHPGRISWLCASGTAIPLPDKSIDHMVCRVVLPFVGVKQAASEIGRIIRPGGTIALSLHPWSFYLRWLSLRPRNWKRTIAGTLILISSAWFNITGLELRLRLGRHRINQSFQTEYRMRLLLQKYELIVRHVVREPEFVVYAKSTHHQLSARG